MPKQPKSVNLHDDSRPLLGPKLKGTSEQELRDLGLPQRTAQTRTRPSDIRVAVQAPSPNAENVRTPSMSARSHEREIRGRGRIR